MEELVKKKKDSKGSFWFAGAHLPVAMSISRICHPFQPEYVTSSSPLWHYLFYSRSLDHQANVHCHLASPIVRQWPLALHWSCSGSAHTALSLGWRCVRPPLFIPHAPRWSAPPGVPQGQESSGTTTRATVYGTTVMKQFIHFVSEETYGCGLYRKRCDFRIHKLVLGRSSLDSLFRKLHWIPSVVNVCQNLAGNHSSDIVRHIVQAREVVNHVVSTGKNEIRFSGSPRRHSHTHTLAPTCLTPPFSRSFVESLITVVPRLYSALTSPLSSISRSPWSPGGGGDSDARGESGAGIVVKTQEARDAR